MSTISYYIGAAVMICSGIIALLGLVFYACLITNKVYWAIVNARGGYKRLRGFLAWESSDSVDVYRDAKRYICLRNGHFFVSEHIGGKALHGFLLDDAVDKEMGND